MKLWQRFCLWPLSFFLLIFLGTGVLLIEQNTRQVFELNLNQLSEEQKKYHGGVKLVYLYQQRPRFKAGDWKDKWIYPGIYGKPAQNQRCVLSDYRGR